MAAFNPEVNKMNNELQVGIEERQIRSRDRDIDVNMKNIQEYSLDAPIYIKNVRRIYKDYKGGDQQSGREEGNLIQKKEKYGEQEWGEYDEPLLEIEIPQKKLSDEETENCFPKEQNKLLQIASLEKNKLPSMRRECQAPMDSIGREQSNMRNSQEYMYEDSGLWDNLDIRQGERFYE